MAILGGGNGRSPRSVAEEIREYVFLDMQYGAGKKNFFLYAPNPVRTPR
jgi:hypothetical protein